jgi:NADH-quinone oxidoreductase subunit N
MDTNFYLSSLSGAIALVIPETMLILAACIFFAVAPFYRTNRQEWLWSRISILLMLTALFMLSPPPPLTSDPAALFRSDSFSYFCRWLGLLTGFGLVLLSWRQVSNRYAGEYYASLLLIIAGTNLVACANDLTTIFLALELISMPTYLLLYLVRSTRQTQEAVTKYFLLSIFSSAMFLYGLSFFYGATGSTNLQAIRETIKAANPNQFPEILTLGLIFVVAGLGFRLTAAPFHFYAPDVYEGSPTLPITLLSVIPKLAGLFGIFQLVNATLLIDHPQFADQITTGTALSAQARDLFWIMALISMILGNVMGLLQNNIRRLMAYSGIAHAGYILFGLASSAAVPPTSVQGGMSGLTAVFFYLVVYTVMTLGFFAVITYLDKPGRHMDSLDDLAGLGRTNPVLAFFLAVFLFSLTGLPPTVGFTGKLYIFLAGWSTGLRHFQLLAVIMAITAAIGAWYYLRIIGIIYLRPSVHPIHPPFQPMAFLTILVAGFITLVTFVVPNFILDPTATATVQQLVQTK